MEKDFFFTQTLFEPKQFYLKKCVYYDKSLLQPNSIKGLKDLHSSKMLKSKIKFQNVPKNATKNRKIATVLTFFTKQCEILQRFYPI